MMLTRGNVEDVSSFVDRTIFQAAIQQAEFIYFELKQHYLLIRCQRASRTRMIWRGTRIEGVDILAHLKIASGMSATVQRVPQGGEFPFTYQGECLVLPAVCKPFLSEERVVLSLRSLLQEAEPPSA